MLIWGLSGKVYSPGWLFHDFKQTISKIQTSLSPQAKLSTISSGSNSSANVVRFSHSSIIATFFWVGEGASGDNGGISNSASTWDEQWLQHFGGVDDPNKRSGYQPSGFTPKENSFYFALPYSDIDSKGNRKISAKNCPLYESMKNSPYSWCKNSWVAIRHNGKVAYAQWEDAGPFGEDDLAYVFGSSAPANKTLEKAGLDVSPAVRDYLGLEDVDKCDWGFISAGSVPSGPWKQTITATTGESVN